MASAVRDANGLVVRLGHTAEFSQRELNQAQRLLELIFEGEMSDRDWEHGLGGVHVMAFRDDVLLGHASVIQRRLVYAGQALRAGYVEAVGVHPSHQRRGIAARMMDELERVIRSAFELGALSATDVGAAFYGRRGWLRWQGPLLALTPEGVTPTPDEAGGVYVFEATHRLDLCESLTADWRDGDVW